MFIPVKICPTCSESKIKGWMSLPGHDGGPCPTCTPKDDSQIGGSGYVIELPQEVMHMLVTPQFEVFNKQKGELR